MTGDSPNFVTAPPEPPPVSDEQFAAILASAAAYTAVILTAGPHRRDNPDADAIILEHGRRNAALHRQGSLRSSALSTALMLGRFSGT